MNAKLQLLKSVLIKYLQPVWKFFVGGVVVLGVISTFKDLKQPDVTVEITSVATASSEPIDLMRVSDLAVVRDFINMGPGLFPLSDVGAATPAMSVEEIDRQIQIAANRAMTRRDEMNSLVQRLDKALSSTTANKETLLEEIEQDNLFLPSIILDDPDTPIRRSPLTQEQKNDATIERIRQQIAQRRKHSDLTMAKMSSAESRWAEYKEKILPNRARLVITAAIGNKGSGATAIKPLGILRANLGEGNYLDLPMKLSGYESSPDLGVIQPHSYKIIRLQSDEVQSMTSAERQRYVTFLGNVAPATIYMTDVNNEVFASNSVPFSPGVYEQKVYDLLKQFASSYTNH